MLYKEPYNEDRELYNASKGSESGEMRPQGWARSTRRNDRNIGRKRSDGDVGAIAWLNEVSRCAEGCEEDKDAIAGAGEATKTRTDRTTATFLFPFDE